MGFEIQWRQLDPNTLYLAPDIQPHQHAITGRMLFLTPCSHQCQSTEGRRLVHTDCRRLVSVLDSRAVGLGFKSHPRRCRVTVLGKLFSRASVHQAVKLVAARVTVGRAESNGSLPPGL